MAERFIVAADNCPACGAHWRRAATDVDQSSRLLAVMDRDTVGPVAWQCPECHRRWPRGAHTADPGIATH